MKRIKFDHKIDWLMLIFLVLAVGFYLVVHSNWFHLEEGRTRFFLLLGGILNGVALSKIFWYKYYVRWNSRAITIKFNSFSGRTIPFAEIEKFEFSDSALTISKRRRRKKLSFPTSGIAEEDLRRLESILLKHTLLQKT
jgi:hypothetical protein